jgi:hypothetical protein
MTAQLISLRALADLDGIYQHASYDGIELRR